MLVKRFLWVNPIIPKNEEARFFYKSIIRIKLPPCCCCGGQCRILGNAHTSLMCADKAFYTVHPFRPSSKEDLFAFMTSLHLGIVIVSFIELLDSCWITCSVAQSSWKSVSLLILQLTSNRFLQFCLRWRSFE